MSIVDVKKLETVLQAHWTEFLDTTKIMRCVLQSVRDADLKILEQPNIPAKQTKITVTQFRLILPATFEVWVEFTVPKNEGVVVGTIILMLSLNGDIEVKETFGTEFQLERS